MQTQCATAAPLARASFPGCALLKVRVMVLVSSDERLAVRFAPYIDELHHFFTGHGLRFGAPPDILPLAERLARPGVFHDEMSSMVRAVIYREQESLTQADLLGLITTAAGGPAVDLTAPEFRAPTRQLLTFIGGALRSLWGQSPGGVKTPERITGVPEPTRVEPQTFSKRVGTQSPLIEDVQVLPDVPASTRRFSTAEPEVPAPSRRSRPGILSRLRAVWREPAQAAKPGDAAYPEYRPLPIFAAHLRPLWAVGIGGILLGLASGLALRNRPPLPHPAPHTAQTPHTFPLPGNENAGSVMRPLSPGSNPIDTFQADNAALQAANAALQAANAKLPPLPVPPHPEKPSPYVVSDSSLPVRDRVAPPAIVASGGNPANRTNTASGMDARTPTVASPPLPTHFSTQRPYRFPGEAMTERASTPRPQPSPLAARPAIAPRERSTRPSYAASVSPAPFPEYRSYPAPPARWRPAPSLPREHVFLSASGAMAGNLLAAPAPEYPELASSSGVEGRVVVQAVVGMDGSVIATHVLSGPEFLRSAAVNAVRRWRYRPYMVDGRPTVVATDAILNFQLQ